MAYKSVSRQRRPAATILRHLAIYGGTRQPELASIVPTRTLIRTLHGLEKLHLIKGGRDRSEKRFRGAPHNLWSLTFDGLSTVLKWRLGDEEVDAIIMQHRDLSPIFERWVYISQGEQRVTAMGLLKSYDGVPFIGEDELGSILRIRTASPLYSHPEAVQGVESFHMQDFLFHMLALEPVMSGLCLLADRSPLCDYFAHLTRDPELRGVIDRFFRLEEGKCRVIQRMRELYNL